jgi:hypothetical protein
MLADTLDKAAHDEDSRHTLLGRMCSSHMMRRCVSSPTSNSQASRSRSILMQRELLSPVSAPSTAPPTSVNVRPDRLACAHMCSTISSHQYRDSSFFDTLNDTANPS